MWMIPTRQQFHDFINTLECHIITTNKSLMSVMKWSNIWDEVGLLGLSTKDLGQLDAFCNYLMSKSVGGMVFTVVPKDMVTTGTTIITLLKNNYRNYDLEILPEALFQRNLYLYGELVVSKSRIFGANDRTLKGEPKEGWRHVELQADPVFMKVLEDYPESHRFTLGSDSIQLWGGKRKPEPQDKRTNQRGNYARAASNKSTTSTMVAGRTTTTTIPPRRTGIHRFNYPRQRPIRSLIKHVEAKTMRCRAKPSEALKAPRAPNREPRTSGKEIANLIVESVFVSQVIKE